MEKVLKVITNWLKESIDNVTEFNSMQLKLEAIGGSRKEAKIIMDYCKVVGKNRQNVEECFNIAIKLMVYGGTFEQIMDKLMVFNRRKSAIWLKWTVSIDQALYNYDYVSFVYEEINYEL